MTDNVISIREKINEKMEKLEKLVSSNYHTSCPHIVKEHIKEIHQYYSMLEPEDRDYVDCIENVIGRDDRPWY